MENAGSGHNTWTPKLERKLASLEILSRDAD